MVDEYFIAFVGGIGTVDEIKTSLAEALDRYNEKYPGSDLVIDF